MNKYILPEEWQPIDNLTLEENALIGIKAKNHVLIEAGPGAGKTELLAQKACYLFQTNICEFPRKILAISFKVDAAANLRERVNSRSSNEFQSRFSSMTYDAFVKKILDQFRNALPNCLRPQANYEIVTNKKDFEEKIRGIGWKELFNPLHEDWACTQFPVDNTSEPHSNQFILLLSGFDGKFTSLLTFPMINILANVILKKNPHILKALHSTYSHIFLDEFQDTTSLQYHLVKKFINSSNTIITAVGDNKQRIMKFAGAKDGIFETFIKEWNAVHVQLMMNHRSAPRLVDLQRRMYASLGVQDATPCLPVDKWDASDGEVCLYKTKSDETEAEKIVEDILSKTITGILPKEICILCKQTPSKYTYKVQDKLKQKGIIARNEAPYQELLKEPIINLILSVIKVALSKSPEDWKYIEDFYHAQFDYSSIEANSNFLFNSKCLQKKINDIKLQLVNNDYADKSILSKLFSSIIDIFGIEYIRSNFPAYKQGYDIKLINKFIPLFHENLITSNFDWLYAVDCFNGKHSIPIMTIHKSKGLEYQAIYFIGLEDKAFWNFRNQPVEERCVFFVAISRAINSLIFSFCENRESLETQHQTNLTINEFFELLQTPGVAKVFDYYDL